MDATKPKMTAYMSIPEYVPNGYNNFALIKFFSEKDQRDYFLSGKLYMRPQTDFALEEMGKGRGDMTEGADIAIFQNNENTYPVISYEERNGEFYIKVQELSEKPAGYKDNQFFISYPVENQKRNIFCLYTLWIDSNRMEIMPIEKKVVKEFGQYGVIIPDVNAFLTRVGMAINNNPTITTARCAFVRYLAEENMRNVMRYNPFLKRAKDYREQNEFRICVDTNNTELLELQVDGDFNDIAFPIRLDEFVKTASYNDGMLRFRIDKEV